MTDGDICAFRPVDCSEGGNEECIGSRGGMTNLKSGRSRAWWRKAWARGQFSS